MTLETTPTLSVITPVYNGEKYIQSCLENVISQECAGIEHLIVDGNSTDGTLEIVKSHAARHAHIRWISEPDRGQSDAMNKGISRAKGTLIGFLNVDDFYEPNVLRRVVEIAKGVAPPAFICGNCRIWNESGTVGHVNCPSLHYPDVLFRRADFPFNPSAYFYHKALHEKAGVYDVEEHYVMDVDFLLRAIPKANCVHVPEVWGNMRYLPGTKTHEDNLAGRSKDRLQAIFEKYQHEAGAAARLRYRILPEKIEKLRQFLGGMKSKLTEFGKGSDRKVEDTRVEETRDQ